MCRGGAGKPYATGIKPCTAARAEAVATGTEAAALASSQSHTLHGASLVQDLGLRGVFSTNHFPFSFFSLLFLLIQSLESITRKNEMATRQPHHAWHPAGHTSAPNPGTRASPCHLPQPHVLSPKHPPLPLFCKFFLFLAFFFLHISQKPTDGPGPWVISAPRPETTSGKRPAEEQPFNEW